MEERKRKPMLSRLKKRTEKPVRVDIIHDGSPVVSGRGTHLPIVAVESASQRNVRLMHGRIIAMAFVFVIVFGVLIIRLAEITLSGPAPEPAVRVIAFDAPKENSGPRAELADRNGNRLAMNAPTIGLAVETRNVWSAKETAEGIASVLKGVDAARLQKKIETRSYVFLRNEISDFEREKLVQLGLPGVQFVAGTKRVYPQGDLAAHLVGQYIAGKGGVMGLEGAIDRLELSGMVVSSIDISAQQILEEELASAMALYQAKAAWGVIMDVRNGEIIALASLPDFNPNAPGNSPADHRRNRVMYDRYELGSAFKPLTAAAALEEGIADFDSIYDVSKKLRIGGRTISDFTPKGPALSFMEVLQYSSNIGAAQMALSMGAERQQDYLRRLGLLDVLETELPERRPSAYPERWGRVETATIAYGHGIAVTPLQLTAAFAAVVNGGTYYRPTFLKQEGVREDGQRVFSQQTSASMRIALRRVITDGTSKGAEAPGYYPIGKTSTADKPSKTGGYQEDVRLSSFIGAFPGYDPRFVILVSLDEPKPTEATAGWATAGWVAAPVFKNVVSRLGPVFGLNPVGDDRAFAGFMREFRQNPDRRLALNEESFTSPDPALDPVGALLMELGP